jgi:hypothetical protein
MVRYTKMQRIKDRLVETEVRDIPIEAIKACRHYVMTPEHYRDDNTCRCDDPDHAEMKSWGYRWRDGQWR